MHQCNAQSTVSILNKHPEYKEVEIDSLFEKLDIHNEKIINNKKTYGITKPVEHSINILDSLSNKIIKINGILERGLSQKIIPINGWFELYKTFYSNGNIKLKAINIKTGFGDFGKLYEFNKEGKLIESIDYDKDYKTSFENITKIADKYAKKYNYKVETAIDGKIPNEAYSGDYEGDKLKISRELKNGKRLWYIELMRKNPRKNIKGKPDEKYKITVDDTTGKVIEKKLLFPVTLPDAMGIHPDADSSD